MAVTLRSLFWSKNVFSAVGFAWRTKLPLRAWLISVFLGFFQVDPVTALTATGCHLSLTNHLLVCFIVPLPLPV